VEVEGRELAGADFELDCFVVGWSFLCKKFLRTDDNPVITKGARGGAREKKEEIVTSIKNYHLFAVSSFSEDCGVEFMAFVILYKADRTHSFPPRRGLASTAFTRRAESDT
jgi:IS30 family transposase